jgi:hypothetical protein
MLLLYLGRPVWMPRDKQIAIFDLKRKFFSAVHFFQFFGHQNPGSRSGVSES